MRQCGNSQNSKRGITLIELICALMVGIVAVAVGFQLYYVGAKAHANSAVLESLTGDVEEYFESGLTDRLQALEQAVNDGDPTISYHFDLGDASPRTFSVEVGAGARVSTQVNVAAIELTHGAVATKMQIFKQSIGTSGA